MTTTEWKPRQRNAHAKFKLPAACLRMVGAALVVTGLAACNVPKDPHHTLEKIQGAEMRVGVLGATENYAVERRWLEELAQDLNASLVFEEGEAHALVEKLRKGDIHLLIAPPAKTAFKKEIGLSQPYRNQALSPAKRVWAVRPGENAWLYKINYTLSRRMR